MQTTISARARRLQSHWSAILLMAFGPAAFAANTAGYLTTYYRLK